MYQKWNIDQIGTKRKLFQIAYYKFILMATKSFYLLK